MAKPIIVAGMDVSTGLDITDIAFNKFDSAGNTYQHGFSVIVYNNIDFIRTLALDAIGNCYFITSNWYYNTIPEGSSIEYDPQFSGPMNIYCVDPNGYYLWAANHKAELFDLALDNDNNVYVVGQAVNNSGSVYPTGGIYKYEDRTGYYTTRKYSASGELLWSADHGFTGQGAELCITVKNGYVYTGGPSAIISLEDTDDFIVKYDAEDGAIIWRAGDATHSNSAYAIDVIVDAIDNVYVVGQFGLRYEYKIIRKYDSDGGFISEGDTFISKYNEYAYGLFADFDSSGNIIIASTRIDLSDSTNRCIHKFDSDCVFVESDVGDVIFGVNQVRAFGIDADDNIYIISSNEYNGLRKYTDIFSSTTEDWSALIYDNRPAVTNGTCLFIKEVELPPLVVDFNLYAPTGIGDAYANIPGLAFQIATGIPSLYRDYTGRLLPKIYRAYLTGGTGTVEFIISNLNIRKTDSGISVNIVIPSANESDISNIEDRTAGKIIIKYGVRFLNGTEQLDELVSVDFDSFRFDKGSRSASVSLSGSSALEANHITTRMINGISYSNINNGKRLVRSNIDTYLSVGDIADLGNTETMTVGELNIYVYTDSAYMEIAESSTA